MVAVSPTKSHAFVSYSRQNVDKMLHVSQALRRANIPVWTDERLTAGTPSWKNAIELAIQGASCVIVLMSPSAKASEWVERELDYAYVLKRPIYPILVEGSQRDSVPFELINMQYIDARTDFDQGLQRLISLLVPHTTASDGESPADTEVAVQPPEPQSVPEIISEQVSIVTSRQPSIQDILLYKAGFKSDDAQTIELFAARLRRIARWYFLEPQKFRLFSAITQDSTARRFHANATMLAYLWVLGSAALCWSSSVGIFSTILLSASPIIFYGVTVLVPLAVPYKSRRALLGSVLYGVVLIALMGVLLLIAYGLVNALSLILKAM